MPAHHATGGCLCGAVRYTVTAPALRVEHCHCSMCRRAHGALIASGALVESAALRVDRGEDALASYESTPGNHRRFCRRCGCQLFMTVDHIPHRAYYWAASLDAGHHPGHRPEDESHIFVASRAAWERLDEPLPRHDGPPERGPGDG